jgi:DeoR/GlpR family transcriptional regulator of sugar metabolism
MDQHTPPTLSAERRAAIAKLAAEHGAVRVADLAARFDVDASTIRRDLKTLEAQESVRRVHGGAVAPALVSPPEGPREGSEGGDAPTDGPQARIGQAAAEMVEAGETIFLGPGRLPLAVAHQLADHARLTIVTNGLAVAHWIAAHTSHTLIVTGGQVEARDQGMSGRLTLAALSSLRADRVVLEMGGVSALEGLTDDSLPQAEVARALLETGSQIIVLVEPDRVGGVAAACVAPVSEADVIVTAREASSSFLWDLSETGVRVVLA